MSTFDAGAPVLRLARAAQPWPLRLAPALYAGTLFLSALLLFAVQPMFTKMILPRLGGAPAVWSVAMVFFQAALLAGYAYAHLLARMLRPQRAAFVHVAVLAVASMALPIGISQDFTSPPEGAVVLWLFGLIAASIGLPFTALAASAPLLQSWFAASGHPRAHNPYVLYAASNLGSFSALLAYPFLIEPLLRLGEQTALWSIGYGVLVVLIAATGLFAARGARTEPNAVIAARPKPALADRAAWIVLAAIPAGLVIAVTAYVTMDVAAAPFLWVLPLALYLLTFVALFRERPWIGEAAVARLLPFAVTPVAISLLGSTKTFWLAVVVVNLAAFLLLALACHGALYRRRPEPARLTEFYLWVSFGGVLGGIFAGLIAPNIFSGTYEYPILIAVALLATSGGLGDWRSFLREAAPALLVAITIAAIRLMFEIRLPNNADIPFQAALVALAALMLLQRRRPARVFGLVVLAFVATELWRPGLARIEIARSFFGVHQVVETQGGGSRYRVLYHGTTIHGAEQIAEPDGTPITSRPQPLTYFYFGGPISEAIETARSAQHGLREVAVIGLGAGSLACHRKDGENWTFFEIDPLVVRIAGDPRLFRFLSDCGEPPQIVLGDARLTLAGSRTQYDLIVLDAFSSDAIPVHLLTREAMAGYLSRLSPHGVLLFHISNRHLDLHPVVAAEAAAEGLVVIAKRDDRANDTAVDFRSNALVAVLARTANDLGELPNRPGWVAIRTDRAAPWTDDYSDVLGALLRMKLGL
jgi:hypothetical protein